MIELFPLTAITGSSPKVLWLDRHNLRLRRETLPRTYTSAHPTDMPFTVHNPSMTRTFCGETEADAIWAAARGLGVPHWAPWSWERAMSEPERRGARTVEEE